MIATPRLGWPGMKCNVNDDPKTPPRGSIQTLVARVRQYLVLVLLGKELKGFVSPPETIAVLAGSLGLIPK